MASIRERTKGKGAAKVVVYHAQVRQAGFPARTATFPTRRQAERWAKTIEAEMIEGRHFRTVEARRRTLADAIDRYLAEEVPKKRDGNMHRICLPWWRDRLGTLKLADVTPAILVEQRGKLERETYTRANPKAKHTALPKGEMPRLYRRSSATVNRYLATLSHVFTVARREWHWATFNPFDGVAKLREARGRIRFLSDEERARLLAATAEDPTLHALVVLALSTAARAGELVGLQWRDVDLQDGRLLFRVTKNAEPRTVWLHGEALRLIRARADVRSPLNHDVFPGAKRGFYDYKLPFAGALRRSGIADFRFHDLRHSAATYLAMQGASEQQLRAIGGWKSGVVRRYVHMAATDAKAALEKLASKVDGKT